MLLQGIWEERTVWYLHRKKETLGFQRAQVSTTCKVTNSRVTSRVVMVDEAEIRRQRRENAHVYQLASTSL